jgi:hypothetical protein
LEDVADKVMPKRFHLKRPKLAQEVVAALADCQDVKAHQRLLAMRMAASGAVHFPADCRAVGHQSTPVL